MRKLIAAAGALILGGTLLTTPGPANAAGCPNGLKYRVIGHGGIYRGIYETPDLAQRWDDIETGFAVKGPGGSSGGATPVTHYWNNHSHSWEYLSSIWPRERDVDWMASVFLDYLDCASA